MKKQWYFADALVILLGLLFRVSLLLVVGLLGLLILLTVAVWARYCLSHLHFQRSLSERRALFGEEITLSISIENAKILPLPWLEVEDRLPRAIGIRGRKSRVDFGSGRHMLESLFSPRWYERVTRQYPVLCNVRGIHTFGPTLLRSGDLFGLTERQHTLDNRQYLVVYPLIVPLSSFNLPVRYPFGNRRAPRRLLEDPSRIVGIRDYVYGDDLRHVHWKATARAMQLQSKVYEATVSYTLTLFLNSAIQLDTYYGFHPELQELSICATASVADWALKEGYSVGLFVNSIPYRPERGMQTTDEKDQKDQKEPEQQEASQASTLPWQKQIKGIRIPPSNHEGQNRRIMDALARVQGHFGEEIEDVIQSERSHLPVGATVVVVTTKVSERLLDILSRLKQSGHVVTILLIGDQARVKRLAGITVYPLGGESTWSGLLAPFSSPTEDSTPQPEREQISSFRL